MTGDQKMTSAGGPVGLFLVILNAIVLEQAIIGDKGWYAMLFITIPLLLFSIIGSLDKLFRSDPSRRID